MKSSAYKSGRRSLLVGSATAALAAAAIATPAAAVVPNEDRTAADIVDNEDRFRGVGVIVTNVVGQGGVGVCTGTLINPRTVLFAAHCVNTRPETAYDGRTVRAAVAFNVNALPGIQNWFANNRSNPELSVFNINRIFWDQRSLLNPAASGFIEADIALASLDTPAAGIPTWALLFSTLPAPQTIDPVRGTGYHVNIVGYGGTGNALQGAVSGIDFRRRAAENMLGGFMSLSDRNTVIFGSAPSTLTQNLYHLDFDSQRRQSPFDFNAHRDNALRNEGTTAGGDSGGPLILSAANNAITNEDLVIGVLSGGSRFFGAQPFSSLGTTSFYQPLSLFWQYIAANNPYRYVTARAGNGNWEDANHWLTTLDPAYRVINEQGQIVNGLPTTGELGRGGTGGDWGSVCIEFRQPGDFCTNLGTGRTDATFEAENKHVEVDLAAIAAAEAQAGGAGREALINDDVAVSPGPVMVDLAAALPGSATFAQDTALPGSVTFAQDTAIGATLAFEPADMAITAEVMMAPEDAPQNVGAPLPAPTLANGLPGATGFVPNNVDPVVSANPALNVRPQYFDVTLAAAGTTTLNSRVTIDRLTIRGEAGLTIAQNAALTSLIDVSQFGGRTTVNGTLTTRGDYTLFSGMLQGTGTIAAPFVTSVAGTISPGTMGTIGTLTINGNLVMASGTTYLVDIGAAGASDRIVVNGAANVGGVVGVGQGVRGVVNGLGQNYTILTATGGVTGAFTAGTLSPILRQAFTYQPNAVLMRIDAASYRTVVDTNNRNQLGFAQLWDQNRPNAALAPLYALDFQSADTIRQTFDALAPVNETTVRSLTAQSVNVLQNFNAARQREADRSRAGGKFAVSGTPLQVAGAALNPMIQPLGATAMALQGGEETSFTEANLPETVGIFLSAGAVSGRANALPGFGARRTGIDGFFVAGGAEFYPAERTVIGLSALYNSLDADSPLGQTAESETIAGSFYVRSTLENGLVIDGQLSLGRLQLDTARRVSFLGEAQSLNSRSRDTLISGAVGVSYDIETGFGTLSPGIEGRHASVAFDRASETGGTLALTFDRPNFKTTQLRGGANFRRDAGALQFNLHGQYVRELEPSPRIVLANFAAGVGPDAGFLLGGRDRNWGETGVSLNYNTGGFTIGAGAETTIGRSDAEMQIYRVQGTYRF